MSKETLYALNVSVSEMREILAAERSHVSQLRSEPDPHSLDQAERIIQKTALLLDFAKQKSAICKAKESAARIRKEYEIFTFGSEQSPES